MILWLGDLFGIVGTAVTLIALQRVRGLQACAHDCSWNRWLYDFMAVKRILTSRLVPIV